MISIKILVYDRTWSSVRHGFNTIVQNLKFMIDETNISLSGVNRLQWKCAKEVTVTISYWTITIWASLLKVTVTLRLSDFAALDSYFRWLGVSSTLQTLTSLLDSLWNMFLNLLNLMVFQSSSCLYQMFYASGQIKIYLHLKRKANIKCKSM